jgi:hypothetical protein
MFIVIGEKRKLISVWDLGATEQTHSCQQNIHMVDIRRNEGQQLFTQRFQYIRSVELELKFTLLTLKKMQNYIKV